MRNLKKFTWEDIYKSWGYHFDDSLLHPLFTEVEIPDSGFVNRTPSLSWWGADSIAKMQTQIQDFFKAVPGSVGIIHMYQMRQGELDTLNYLWEYKDEKAKIAAILISASLFFRLDSSRKEFPHKFWNLQDDEFSIYKKEYSHPISSFEKVEILKHLSIAEWNDTMYSRPWHYSSTYTFPASGIYDYDYVITSVDALMRYLAEEHVRLLSKYKPVVIKYL